jgi:hypothetical protein
LQISVAVSWIKLEKLRAVSRLNFETFSYLVLPKLTGGVQSEKPANVFLEEKK